MTKRTLVGYWRDCWSWLITGAAKDKTTLSPSCAAPSKYDEKNIGQLNMANPYISEQALHAQQSLANPFWERKTHIELTAAQSSENYKAVASRYEKMNKFKKQIDVFSKLKAKRNL